MDTDNNSVVDPDMDTSGQLDDSETGDDDFLPTKQQMHSKRSKHKSHERSISKKQKKANGVG